MVAEQAIVEIADRGTSHTGWIARCDSTTSHPADCVATQLPFPEQVMSCADRSSPLGYDAARLLHAILDHEGRDSNL